jgi:hypothetical protein
MFAAHIGKADVRPFLSCNGGHDWSNAGRANSKHEIYRIRTWIAGVMPKQNLSGRNPEDSTQK